MSTRLDLPPERDLPLARRREIRSALVRASHPSVSRRRLRWVLLPVAAVVVGLAVVLGLTRPWDLAPPVVGVPSPSPTAVPTPRPGPTRSTAPPPAVPSATPIDRGPLSAGARAKAVQRCQSDLGRATRVAQVHFARRTSSDGDVVLFTGRDGLSYACSAGGSSLYAGSGSKTGALPEPSRRRPVVRITSPGAGGSRSSGGSARSYSDSYYRVGPEVASLQMRLTVLGHTGPWFEASVTSGYAWAAASVDYANPDPMSHDDDAYEVEDRAFDADGNELEIDRTPR